MFASPRVSPDYYTLDQTTPVYEMPQVVGRLNVELTRLSLPSISPVKTFEEFIEALRAVIKASNRSKAIDWLVGHKNPEFWDLANEKNVWSLPKDDLYAFCDELFESTKE